MITKYERLSDKRNLVSNGLENYFGKPLTFSTDKLSLMDEKDLLIIKSTIDGMILTIENVPDISKEYDRLKDTDLPSRVSFGHLSHDKKVKNVLLNKLHFIEWAVQGNQKVVVILHKDEVIRGRALAFHENVLQIKSEEVIHEIKVDELRDIFIIKKGE